MDINIEKTAEAEYFIVSNLSGIVFSSSLFVFICILD